VNLRPRLDEALLSLRHATGEAFQRVNRKDCRMILVERVKVRTVVLTSRFQEHPDDDSKNRESSGTRVHYIVGLSVSG
jgi:hypothetical protein